MTHGTLADWHIDGLRGLGDEETESSVWEDAGKFLKSIVGTAGEAVKVFNEAKGATHKSGSDLAIMSAVDQATAALQRSADAVTTAAQAAAAAAKTPPAAQTVTVQPSSGIRWGLVAVAGAAAVGGVVVVEAAEAAAPMKGWLQTVLFPTLNAALAASVPLSTLWLLYQATPRYTTTSDADRAEAARVREESTAAITSTVLTVVGIAGTVTYFAGRRAR